MVKALTEQIEPIRANNKRKSDYPFGVLHEMVTATKIYVTSLQSALRFFLFSA